VKEYLKAVDLREVECAAVDLDMVVLDTVSLEALDQDGGVTGAETVFIA